MSFTLISKPFPTALTQASAATPAMPLKLGVTIPVSLRATANAKGAFQLERLIDPQGNIRRPVAALFEKPLLRFGGLTVKGIDVTKLYQNDSKTQPDPMSPIDILLVSGRMEAHDELLRNLYERFLARVLIVTNPLGTAVVDIHYHPQEQILSLKQTVENQSVFHDSIPLNKHERVQERLEKSLRPSVWRTLTQRFLENGKSGTQDAAQRAQRAINLALPLTAEYLTFLELDWNRSQGEKADKDAELIRPFTNVGDFDVEQAFERFRYEWGEFQFPRRD